MSVSPLRFFAGSGFVDNEVFKAEEVARWPPSGEGAFPPLGGEFFRKILSFEVFPHSLIGVGSQFWNGNSVVFKDLLGETVPLSVG